VPGTVRLRQCDVRCLAWQLEVKSSYTNPLPACITRADHLRVIDVGELTCYRLSGVVAEGKVEWSARWPRGMVH